MLDRFGAKEVLQYLSQSLIRTYE